MSTEIQDQFISQKYKKYDTGELNKSEQQTFIMELIGEIQYLQEVIKNNEYQIQSLKNQIQSASKLIIQQTEDIKKYFNQFKEQLEKNTKQQSEINQLEQDFQDQIDQEIQIQKATIKEIKYSLDVKNKKMFSKIRTIFECEELDQKLSQLRELEQEMLISYEPNEEIATSVNEEKQGDTLELQLNNSFLVTFQRIVNDSVDQIKPKTSKPITSIKQLSGEFSETTTQDYSQSDPYHNFFLLVYF